MNIGIEDGGSRIEVPRSWFVVRRSWFVVLLGPKLRLGPHCREALLRLRTTRTHCVTPSSILHTRPSILHSPLRQRQPRQPLTQFGLFT
jgi:hypothetical protein